MSLYRQFDIHAFYEAFQICQSNRHYRIYIVFDNRNKMLLANQMISDELDRLNTFGVVKEFRHSVRDGRLMFENGSVIELIDYHSASYHGIYAHSIIADFAEDDKDSQLIEAYLRSRMRPYYSHHFNDGNYQRQQKRETTATDSELNDFIFGVAV